MCLRAQASVTSRSTYTMSGTSHETLGHPTAPPSPSRNQPQNLRCHFPARALQGKGLHSTSASHSGSPPRGCHKDAHPFFFYYGIHSLMFGGYPPTAIGYTPTAIGYTPTAIGYTPTAIGYTPTAIGYPVTHQPPSVTHQTPSVTHQPPSVTHQPPSVTHQPPSVTHQWPSVTHQPPSVTHRPPS